MRKTLSITVLLVLLVSLTILALETDSKNDANIFIGEGESITNESFYTLEGEKIQIDKYFEGPEKYILLDIWATRCEPCVNAINDFQENVEFFDRNSVKIIAISLGDTERVIKDFISEHKISFEILLDKKMTIIPLWGIKGIPTTFLLNKDGLVIMRTSGYINFNHFKNVIMDVLKKT